MKNYFHLLTQLIIRFCVATVLFASSMLYANNGPYADHVAEMSRLSAPNSPGQLSINSGDAAAAEPYSRANQMPFNMALKGLTALNSNAFLDKKNNLSVGAAFVLPTKSEVTHAANGEVLASDSIFFAPQNSVVTLIKPSVEEDVAPKNVEVNIMDASIEEQKPEHIGVQKNPVPVASVLTNDEQEMMPFDRDKIFLFIEKVYQDKILLFIEKIDQDKIFLFIEKVEPWVWYLLAGLVLIILVLLRLLFKKSPEKLQQEERNTKKSEDPEQAIALEKRSIGQPYVPSVLTEHSMLLVDEDELPELDEPTQQSMSKNRFNQLLDGLSESSLDLKSLSAHKHSSVDVKDLDSSLFPSAYIFKKRDVDFFNHSLKTPMYQLEKILDVIEQAVQFAKAKEQASEVAKVSDAEIESSLTESLDVNVPQFLRHFSTKLPEPTYTSVDYEDLLDRSRLKEWLALHAPEQLLLYAQDAHESRYSDVAQLILNDVLLRGDSEHISAVANLRHMWSYPREGY